MGAFKRAFPCVGALMLNQVTLLYGGKAAFPTLVERAPLPMLRGQVLGEVALLGEGFGALGAGEGPLSSVGPIMSIMSHHVFSINFVRNFF